MKILLLGKDGQVGWELQRSLAPLGTVVAAGRSDVDLGDGEALRDIVRAVLPEIIVNAAAYTAVDKAEAEPGLAQRINADAVEVLAREAAALGAWLVHYSTDYVFDGSGEKPWREDDPKGPLSVYGRTKLAGEESIRRLNPRHLIFRTSWVYAARGGNFAKTMLRLARERDSLKVVADQWGAPTSAELLADVTALALYRLLQNPAGVDGLAGTYHLAAGGETNWCEYARYVVELAKERGVVLKAGPERIEPIPTVAYPLPAARPLNSRLDTGKIASAFGVVLPDWQVHLRRMVDELSSLGAL